VAARTYRRPAGWPCASMSVPAGGRESLVRWGGEERGRRGSAGGVGGRAVARDGSGAGPAAGAHHPSDGRCDAYGGTVALGANRTRCRLDSRNLEQTNTPARVKRRSTNRPFRVARRHSRRRVPLMQQCLKKSHAITWRAWAWRNARHVCSRRRGDGSNPACLRIDQMVEGAMR
jgi:hypothetical protein